MESDSIVALVTPPGEGGVGIVRASGPIASALPSRLFPGLRGRWRSHHARVGRLTDPKVGAVVDEALGLLMQAPRSYTGEDVFEIHCHGSPLVLERVVRICLEEGCRAARPGEFTLRAFLNGRMDLTQAEAVIDVVRAKTNTGLDLAVRQLSGWLSSRIAPVRTRLIGVLAHMEAMVDFVEDDIPPRADSETLESLRDALAAIHGMLEGAEQGIILREGATLAIVGSPNVGKSSIMNALLGLERSIVTPIAGTTRDTVEETLQVRGVAFRTVDTAGITPTDDLVEGLGIERSKRAIEAADVVLLVFDRSRPFGEHDALTVDAVMAAQRIAQEEGRTLRTVIAQNKADLPTRLSLPEFDSLATVAIIDSDTVSSGGVDALRGALQSAALGGDRRDVVVSNVRHQDALQRAAGCLGAALDGLDNGIPLDLVSFDVRASAAALGEITGESVDDELLDRIFRDFCIGK